MHYLFYYIWKDNFDESWFVNGFLSEMQTLLKTMTIYRNEKGILTTLSNIIIPKFEDLWNKKRNKEFYSLVIDFEHQNYVSYDDSIRYNELLSS